MTMMIIGFESGAHYFREGYLTPVTYGAAAVQDVDANGPIYNAVTKQVCHAEDWETYLAQEVVTAITPKPLPNYSAELSYFILCAETYVLGEILQHEEGHLLMWEDPDVGYSYWLFADFPALREFGRRVAHTIRAEGNSLLHAARILEG